MEKFIVPGVFFLFSLPVIIEDCKSLSLNPVWLYAGLLVSAICGLIFERDFFIPSVISAATNFVLYLIIFFILKNKMGFGDVKYAALCGFACKNPFYLIFANLATSCSALLYFLILYFLKKDIRRKKIPFTPFMFAGTIIILWLC